MYIVVVLLFVMNDSQCSVIESITINVDVCVGQSGHVRYTELPAGSYVFRVLAKTRFGERAVVRRIIHIGMCIILYIHLSLPLYNA